MSGFSINPTQNTFVDCVALPRPHKVWVVTHWYDYGQSGVDSVWSAREAAEQRAANLPEYAPWMKSYGEVTERAIDVIADDEPLTSEP